MFLGGLERVKGIEPSSQAWEARILPLNHTRFRSSNLYQNSGPGAIPLLRLIGGLRPRVPNPPNWGFT